MSRQTAIADDPTIAVEGQVDRSYSNDIISYCSEDDILNGSFCSQGTADRACELPDAAGDVTDAKLALGVAIFDPTVPTNWPSTVTVPYPAGQMVPILHRGRCYVAVETSCTAGGAVYVRQTADGLLTRLGAFNGSAGTGLSLLPCAKFCSTQATAGGLALLEINLP